MLHAGSNIIKELFQKWSQLSEKYGGLIPLSPNFILNLNLLSDSDEILYETSIFDVSWK